jgi:assimilatory nitrate reductase catalytic subunit
MADAIRTTCPYCGVGCGIVAGADADGRVAVAGDPLHPANRGRLCVKGGALGETVGLEGRLLQPRIDGRPASWDQALDRVATTFTQVVEQHGPEAVAFYLSGQLLTEDYYVANKLMKGFLGSANVDTNSRLCMASTVAGQLRAFGSDTVPGCYEDLELADLVILVGSNTAWCHPVLFQRIEAARAARPSLRLVVIDPRRTATAAEADLHLAIRPGSDVALFNGLLTYLVRHGVADADIVEAHTVGFDDTLQAARRDRDTAALCGVDPADIETFFQWFAATERTVTIFSQGVNQSSSGTDKVNAIINCHLLTGRIGRPGMGPLSLTGQPNAMGGREVGGMATTLAAHMGFSEDAVDRVRRFWNAPRVADKPGLKAVEMFQAVADGRIKALWIMGTNPAVSLPDSGAVRAALARCPFVVVSDAVAETDTTAFAHVLLPALTWGERDGTVTNSERRISRQRPFLPAPGQARADWRIIAEVAGRMRFQEAFDYAGPADIFREHCRLSAFENKGTRDFDLSGLIDADYDTLAPLQWPVPAGGLGTDRLFADGRFHHPDGRARFVAVESRPPAGAVSDAWPWLLNSGRTRDHWHTLTRTGQSPRLSSHRPEPWVAVNPGDAQRVGLADGDLARVQSASGEVTLVVSLDAGQRLGEVFVPMHWNDQFAASANVGRLIGNHRDPWSGQPELKITPVRLSAVPVAWHGLLLSRQGKAQWPKDVIWSRSAGQGHWVTRLAGPVPAADWMGWLDTALGGDAPWLSVEDRRMGLFRAARLVDGRLDAVFFVSPRRDTAALAWLGGLFAATPLDPLCRGRILAGGAATRADRGRIVCACHQVGEAALREAIDREGLTNVADIGRSLRAGTGCGSCLPEIRRMLPGKPARSTAA